MITALFTREEFKKQSEEFRIGAIISDGMWYSLPKWRKIAKVTEPVIMEWIDRHLKNGMLVQSETGAKSYRFPLESIEKWYEDHEIPLGSQLIDFLFPPRIWGGKTEIEGFIDAPLREIGIVSFACSTKVAEEISEKLRGIARVRETEPNHYKAYCLDSSYVKSVVEATFKSHAAVDTGKIYSRAVAKRRELVDFSPEFSEGIVLFYKSFGKTFVKKAMDTISIFLPDPEDQDTQVVMWVITAIEKFDESTSVPFSGYLNSVLKRWPYDLPYNHLGKELSNFQRQRAKAIEALKQRTERQDFTGQEIAQEMGVDRSYFQSLEEKHKFWLSSRNPTTLTWTENSEEKTGQPIQDFNRRQVEPSDIVLANKISLAIVQTALTTESWEDAYSIITQVDANDLNIAKIQEVSEDFIQSLGDTMGIGESYIATTGDENERAV